MPSDSGSRLERLLSWMTLRGRTRHAAKSGVRVGQKWKVCSQGEWLDATVSRFEDGLVILRFDQPGGSREGVTLPHFMLTTPDGYRLCA